MLHTVLTPVQFENAKRTATWVVADQFCPGGGQTTILMTETVSDCKNPRFSVVQIADDLEVVDYRVDLSNGDAVDLVAQMMKDEHAF